MRKLPETIRVRDEATRAFKRVARAARWAAWRKAMNPNRGLVIFSLIEAVAWATVTAVTAAAIVTFIATDKIEVPGPLFLRFLFSRMAAIVFAAGFVYGIVEHLVAYNTGKGGRPFFQFPLRP